MHYQDEEVQPARQSQQSFRARTPKKQVRIIKRFEAIKVTGKLCLCSKSYGRYVWDKREGHYFIEWWEGKRRRRELGVKHQAKPVKHSDEAKSADRGAINGKCPPNRSASPRRGWGYPDCRRNRFPLRQVNSQFHDSESLFPPEVSCLS